MSTEMQEMLHFFAVFIWQRPPMSPNIDDQTMG
jgi:hypothetical protein